MSTTLTKTAMEGKCPGRRCRQWYDLTADGLLPDHLVSGGSLDRRRCRASRVPTTTRKRRFWFAEGVPWV